MARFVISKKEKQYHNIYGIILLYPFEGKDVILYTKKEKCTMSKEGRTVGGKLLITPWGYLGYSLLFSIPVIGLIFALVFAFKQGYMCRRNYGLYVP